MHNPEDDFIPGVPMKWFFIAMILAGIIVGLFAR